MREILIIDTTRKGYSPEQCGRTLTVGELIEILENYDECTEIYTGHDNRYTYGSIYRSNIELEYEEEEE